MLKVSKLADYATVVAVYMASGEDRSFNAKDIANNTHVPLPTVSKLLKLLGKAGILVSQRGTLGGYRLTNPADKISVAQIIDAIEGPFNFTECCDLTGRCVLETNCQVSSNWQLISKAMRRSLERISLASMAKPLNEEILEAL